MLRPTKRKKMASTDYLSNSFPFFTQSIKSLAATQRSRYNRVGFGLLGFFLFGVFMKYLMSFLTVSLLFSQWCFSQSASEPDWQSLYQNAVLQNKSYLPQYLLEQKSVCQLYPPGTAEQIQCWDRVSQRSHEVLTCESNELRWQEMADTDLEQADQILIEQKQIAVPESIQTVFTELVTVAQEIWIRSQLNNSLLPISQFSAPHWNLKAYSSAVYNAQSGAGGNIIISNQFWAHKSPFSIDEIRAILAHEISHTLQNHSLQMGCIALEWMGGSANTSLKEATKTIREDFTVSFGPGKAWSELSQKNEFQADKEAVYLLMRAGFNGSTMSLALEKLKSTLPSDGGFSSGSHPTLDSRIIQSMDVAHSATPLF